MLKNSLFLLPIFIAPQNIRACLGPSTEEAQERDASILFEGQPVGYLLGHGVMQQQNSSDDKSPEPLARVTFKVTQQIRGEKRREWIALMRGSGLPKSLNEFKKRFGTDLRVGLRDFGKAIDPNKLPLEFRHLPFIVDAACSMNGGDWLLRPIH